MNLKMTTRTLGNVTVIDISGRIVLGSESASLRSLSANNLADVNYIDSSGLGHLVSLHHSTEATGRIEAAQTYE